MNGLGTRASREAVDDRFWLRDLNTCDWDWVLNDLALHVHGAHTPGAYELHLTDDITVYGTDVSKLINDWDWGVPTAQEPVDAMPRGHETAKQTTCPRTFKYMHLRYDHGIDWFDKYYREDKQYHGRHARGPANRVQYHEGGRVYMALHTQPSYTCWKDNGRAYQAHGRQRTS